MARLQSAGRRFRRRWRFRLKRCLRRRSWHQASSNSIVEHLPRALLDARLADVMGQLHAVDDDEMQACLLLTAGFYQAIGRWHRQFPETPIAVYRAAAAEPDHRYSGGGERSAYMRALEAADQLAAEALGNELMALTDQAIRQGVTRTACRGASRMVTEILRNGR